MSRKQIISILLFFISTISIGQTAYEVLDKMIQSIENHNQYHYNLVTEERIENILTIRQSEIKVQHSPYKVYLRVVTDEGKTGPEVLYIPSWNEGEAFVSPNQFPNINISLDPEGHFMRSKKHYGINKAGFLFVKSIMKHHYLNKYSPNQFNAKNTVSKLPNGDFKLITNEVEFRFKNYTVLPNENLKTIAEKFLLNDYMILENNPIYDDYDEVKEGEIIKIPTSFMKVIELIIDKKTYLPKVQTLIDDRGVYSIHHYNFITFTPKLTNDDFSDKNPEYGF